MVGLSLGYSYGQHVQYLGHVVPKQKVPGEGRRREDICPGTSRYLLPRQCKGKEDLRGTWRYLWGKAGGRNVSVQVPLGQVPVVLQCVQRHPVSQSLKVHMDTLQVAGGWLLYILPPCQSLSSMWCQFCHLVSLFLPCNASSASPPLLPDREEEALVAVTLYIGGNLCHEELQVQHLSGIVGARLEKFLYSWL